MSVFAEDRRALVAVRVVLRGRRHRPRSGDFVYGFYLAVMLVITALAPVARALLLWLAEVLPEPGVGLPAVLVAGLGLAALILLPFGGGYLRVLRVSLPELDLLFTTGLSRSRLLAARTVRLFAGAAAAGAMLAALLFAARAMRGEVAADSLLPVLGAGAGIGVFAALLLLAGQLSRGAGWQRLRDQAVRFDAVSTLAMTGDLHGAAGRLGAPVTVGRHWHWRVPSGGALLIASRDLLGIARTPARTLAALLGMFGAVCLAVLSTVSLASSPISAAIFGAVALLAAYTALGPWSRGLRVAGQATGAAPMLPYSAAGLLLRHLIVPGALSVIVCGVGASVAAQYLPRETLLAGTVLPVAAAAPPAFVVGTLLGMFAVLLRLLGALKGPLPQQLLAPVPTPAGDMSGVNIMIWNLDGPIWALLLGAGLGAIAAVSSMWAVLLVFAALVLLLLWSAARLRAAAGQR